MPRDAQGGMSLHGPAGNRKYLNTAERKRFRRVARSLPPAEKVFCLLLMWSGARLSELLALTADAVDLEAGTIALETLKRRKRGLVRHVPVPPDILSALKIIYRIRTLQRDANLARQRLWPWSRATGWRCIKKVMARAGIRGLAAMPKALRHTFGVNAFQRGVPPHLVQRWLGHASLRTTAIYGDFVGPDERKLAARMWKLR
jgi:integrase